MFFGYAHWIRQKNVHYGHRSMTKKNSVNTKSSNDLYDAGIKNVKER